VEGESSSSNVLDWVRQSAIGITGPKEEACESNPS
jgi:hypothetical protein